MPAKLHVINLFGGPGAGKSTMAAALFNLMKRQRFSVELVTEVAKDMTYDKAWKHLSDQLLVLAEQHHRLWRLKGEVRFVITDSPFPLGLVYADELWSNRLTPLIQGMWTDFDNHSFRLQRSTKRAYQQFGRSQTEQEAIVLDRDIARMAYQYGTGNYPLIDTDDPAAEYHILDHVCKALNLPTVLPERHY